MIPILAFAAAAATPPANPPIVVVAHVWAPFISPMGEPFRAHTKSDDTLALWFNQADRNRDGVLTADEMAADAARFFATLDTDRNGQIDPLELVQYEWELAPEIQVNSKRKRLPGETAPAAKPKLAEGSLTETSSSLRGGARWIDEELQGGARYALLNIPEPVAAADADLNRAITQSEFRQAAIQRFQLLDQSHRGALTLQQLDALRQATRARGSKRRKDDPDTRYGVPLPPGN